MNNTTQLLMDCARAAGYEVHWNTRHKQYFWASGIRWNPIESEADAFRLMVDCGLDIRIRDGFVWAANNQENLPVVTDRPSNHNNDKHAATRMAIVRAAAQSQEKDREQ